MEIKEELLRVINKKIDIISNYLLPYADDVIKDINLRGKRNMSKHNWMSLEELT